MGSLGFEVSSEAIILQELLVEVMRKMCSWWCHQNFKLQKWNLCAYE